MAPQRPRAALEDFKTEASSIKEKQTTATPASVFPKAKRNGAFSGSPLRDAVVASSEGTARESSSHEVITGAGQ